MAKLEGQTIADSYEQLLHTDRNGGGNGTTLVNIKDGKNDNTFALQLATDKIQVNGDATISKNVGAGSGETAFLTLSATDGGVNMSGGEGASILFKIPDDETNPSVGASIAGVKENADDSISNTALVFRTSQNDETLDEAMRITSAGNVGIGVTPETTNSVASALQVGGNGYLLSTKAQGASGEMDFGYNFYWAPDGNYKYISTDEASMFRQGGGNFLFRTAPSGSADATATFTERMRITQAGNVGIGTASPDNTLHIFKGDAGSVSGTDGATTPLVIENNNHNFIQFLNPSDKQAGLYFGSPSENYYHGTIAFDEANERLVFEVDAVKKLVVDANSRISLTNNDASDENTVFGYSAFNVGSDATSDYNTSIGHLNMGSGTLSGATYNTSVGWTSMQNLTSGDFNSSYGIGSGGDISSGGTNICIGAYAGNTGDSWDLTTGSDNIYLGVNATGLASGAIGQIVIGRDARGQGDNTVTLGSASVTDVYMSQDSQAYVHAQNVPNHVANTMSSPYYRFDGVDDIITVSDSPHLDGFTKFSVTGSIYLPNTNGNYGIVRKYHTAGQKAWMIYMDSNEFLYLTVSSDGTNSEEQKLTTALTVGAWNHFALTFDSGTFLGYINGALSGVDANFSTQTSVHSGSDTMVIGNASYSDYDLEGSIQNLKVFNKTLTATEVKDDYSGASVPFKYKGANQTNLLTGGDADFGSTASGWVNSNVGGGYDESGDLSATATSSGQWFANNVLTKTVGKRYRLTFDVASLTSTWTIQEHSDSDSAGSIGTVSANGTQSFEFTSKFATGLRFVAGANDSSANFDNFSVVPIGAVAEYDGSGAGEKVWGDKSGNDLHGTVSGATLENTPYDSGTEYEEGIFTPTIQGIDSNLSYTTQAGYYIKIGNMVTFNAYIATSTGTGGALASANVEVQSLPYTSSATTHNRGSVTIGFFDNVDEDGSSDINAFVNSNSTVVEFYKMTGARFIGTDMDTAGMEIRISGTYFTD